MCTRVGLFELCPGRQQGSTAVAKLCRGCDRLAVATCSRAKEHTASADSNDALSCLIGVVPMCARRRPSCRCKSSAPDVLSLLSRGGTQQTEQYVELLLPTTGRQADVPAVSLQIAPLCTSPTPTTGFILNRLKGSTALWHPSSKMDLWASSQRACPCIGSTNVDHAKPARQFFFPIYHVRNALQGESMRSSICGDHRVCHAASAGDWLLHVSREVHAWSMTLSL
jgi:hypothetical protein